MINAYDKVVFESVSSVTATPSEELGARKMYDGREYVYVYNGGADAQINPGYICVATGTSGYTVTVSSVVDPVAQPFGVVRNATLTTGTYGWVVKRGFTDLYSEGSAAVSAGQMIRPGADGSVGIATGGTGVTGPFFAKAMQATATAGTFGAYVNCP